MRNEDGQTIRLEDYRPTPFAIDGVEMTVALHEGRAEIITATRFSRREGTPEGTDLVLDGDELRLVSIALDGALLPASAFEASAERLVVKAPPPRFELRIETTLSPETNSQLMGLYRSNGVWTTQCEAEGFRRITYFLDRPDILARYRVRIEADRKAAPVLLANGNPVESGELADGRHYAVWDDPWPKPSYLFALVAGDLDILADRFTTASGRPVDLAIYTERGLAPRAAYAMDAVKRSMLWDERRFGREYDLDVFNIVAVSDFNMGAMENKGLNVFNHKYVLLDPDTATDGDYAGVETVIAHEYFHNWTGNRITCRDWFQLCLKEGLTVYRDQEFTADERSATVKRVSSVRALRAQQFPEDQGPLQHPVRPTRYREINNFYTATVYDKGAEVVRMLATVLGSTAFRAGMDLYFRRHDGEATTIEAFLACFADVSGRDLSQFALWYAQAGTPDLWIDEEFDEASRRLQVRLRQSLRQGAAGTGTKPMHLPVRYALVDQGGTELGAGPTSSDVEVAAGLIHLTAPVTEIVFEGLTERPLLSILRDFSAPVTLHFDQDRADRLALARLDPDDYGRWSALSGLVEEHLTRTGRGEEPRDGVAILTAVAEAAADETLDPALRSLMTTMPSESEIARLIASDVDPGRVHAARVEAMASLGRIGGDRFQALRERLSETEFSPDAASVGRRALRNTLLAYAGAASGSPDEAAAQFGAATNMTDRFEALAVLAHLFPADSRTEAALADFYRRFEGNDLVIDKWFMLQASVPAEATLEVVKQLAAHPAFRLSNPNRARALIAGLASGNPLAFHRPDGAGHAFVADILVQLDRQNPQTAARLATSFRSFRSLEPKRRASAERELKRMQNMRLSRDLKDIVNRTLL